MRQLVCLLSLIAAITSLCADAKAAPAAKPGKTATASAPTEKAVFAAGCFWKVQYVFSKVPGVVKTTAGYSGGKTASPTYKEVCSDRTGHAEVVQVEFDPSKVSYSKLLEVFFSNHDPTTLNRQGPDIGTQYRSAVFYTNPSQKAQAEQFKQTLEKEHKFQSKVVTAIEPAKPFYAAEDYHQDYFKKHGQACD